MTKNKAKPQIGIMKAKPLTKRLLSQIGTTCIAQPKLRGQRCRTVWTPGGVPILLSSYGIPFQFLDHIQQALMQLPRKQYDGELYYHHPDYGQERINSILNRTTNPHPDRLKIQYHIFDIISTDPQWLRLMLRDSALHSTTLPSSIQIVPYELIQSASWLQKCSAYIKQGYEGIILRHTDGLYRPLDPVEQAKRPSTMLKYKPTHPDSYTIVGLNPGTGWAEGMLGSFSVQGEDGNIFSVGTGPELTKAKRQHYWSIRKQLIGRKLIVKHELTKTTGGIPICTTAYRIE